MNIIMNYKKIADYFNSPSGQSALSMNNADKLMSIVAQEDRSMVEKFIRTELGVNILTLLTVIPNGLYSLSDDIKALVIPKNIKKIEDSGLTYSSIKGIKIENGALDGILDLSVFNGASNLQVVDIPDTINLITDNKHNITLKDGKLPYVIMASGHWCDNFEDERIDLDVYDDVQEAIYNGGIKEKK